MSIENLFIKYIFEIDATCYFFDSYIANTIKRQTLSLLLFLWQYENLPYNEGHQVWFVVLKC